MPMTVQNVLCRLNPRTTLAEVLNAIVADDRKAARLVRKAPEIALARVVDDRLVSEPPHQLYVGDTALHIAAAALQPRTVRALLDAGAHPNAENRRGAWNCFASTHACKRRRVARGQGVGIVVIVLSTMIAC